MLPRIKRWREAAKRYAATDQGNRPQHDHAPLQLADALAEELLPASLCEYMASDEGAAAEELLHASAHQILLMPVLSVTRHGIFLQELWLNKCGFLLKSHTLGDGQGATVTEVSVSTADTYVHPPAAVRMIRAELDALARRTPA